MRIACLGWGSLVWDPRSLPLERDKPRWFTDGPELPVEFARQSSDGRITLVIVPPNASEPVQAIQVLWAFMTCATVDEAHEALARREWGTGPVPPHWTGKNWINWKTANIAKWTKAAGGNSAYSPKIGVWANVKGLDALVWTVLPPQFAGVRRVPTCAEVLGYLQGPSAPAIAKDYICKTPPQIRTDYRTAIENVLHWTCDRSATKDEIHSAG